jgi:uncharacterized protein YdeI (YjbR/CyaY-like superfamily)
MITDVATYFEKGCGRCPRFDMPDCSTRSWHQGLSDLRKLCLEEGLVEVVKWGHPCYMHCSRNIAILGAFRSNFRLSFFNAALMKDPHRILQKSGPNTRDAGCLIFTANEEPSAKASVIRAYLQEAMGYAEAGIRPRKTAETLEVSGVLAEMLAADPDMHAAFHALTRGRQRSYIMQVNAAKRDETKRARIARYREKILRGKGPHE